MTDVRELFPTEQTTGLLRFTVEFKMGANADFAQGRMSRGLLLGFLTNDTVVKALASVDW